MAIEPKLEIKQDSGQFTVLTVRPMNVDEPCLDITGDCSLDREEVTTLRNYLSRWLQQTE